MLSLSSDRKTAPSCKWETNQRRWKPRTLNAIGFPAVTTCPSRTPTCEADCYAKRIPYPSALKLLACLLGIDRVTEPVRVVTDLRQCLTRTSTHGRIRLARDPQADAGGRVASR